MERGLRIEQLDGVRVLHMEFGSANALGRASIAALIDALRDEPVPTVLTGEGKIFSAGLNLPELDPLDRSQMEAFVEEFSEVMIEALAAPFPLVAAVNGHAVAGGCVLAMACDRRVGVDGPFRIGMNEMAIGLTLPSIVTEIIRGRLSPEHSHTVILGGALYDPADAVEVGLLDDVTSDSGAAIARSAEVARQLGHSLREFAAMKRNLVRPIVKAWEASRVELDTAFLDSWFAEPATALRTETIARLQRRS